MATFPLSQESDLENAIKAAREADKAWRLVPAPKRAEYLYKVGEIITRRKEELAIVMTREMGKTLTETRGDGGERLRFLSRGRGDKIVRTNGPLGTAQQIRHDGTTTDRRLCFDYLRT